MNDLERPSRSSEFLVTDRRTDGHTTTAYIALGKRREIKMVDRLIFAQGLIKKFQGLTDPFLVSVVPRPVAFPQHCSGHCTGVSLSPIYFICIYLLYCIVRPFFLFAEIFWHVQLLLISASRSARFRRKYHCVFDIGLYSTRLRLIIFT